jgi:hypothetical protein
MTAPTTTHPTALELDRLEMSDLPAQRAAEVGAHVSACDACRRDLEQLRSDRARFGDHVFQRSLPAVKERVRGGGRPALGRRLGLWIPALAAVTAVLVVVPRLKQAPPAGTTAEQAEPDLATKGGGAALTIVARVAGKTFAVGPSTGPLAAGTEIRFVVENATLPFLMIASVDARGQATIYYPFDGRRSAPLGPRSAQVGGAGPASRVEVPDSIVLDAAPGPERVFALLSRAPLEAAQVKRELARLGAAGPAGIRATRELPVAAEEQSSVLLEKATSP